MGEAYWKMFLFGKGWNDPQKLKETIFLIGIQGILEEFENWLFINKYLK